MDQFQLISISLSALALLVSVSMALWQNKRQDTSNLLERLIKLEIFRATYEERMIYLVRLVEEHEVTRKLRATEMERKMMNKSMNGE